MCMGASDLAYEQGGNGLMAGDILDLLPQALKELGTLCAAAS